MVAKQDGRVNVRFRERDVARMRVLAESHGVTVSTLIRLWAFRGLRRRILPESARVAEDVGESVLVSDV
jgi:hypothetical protein